jgi:uncharacterized protein HemY
VQVIDIRTRLHGPTTTLIGLAHSSLGELRYRQRRYVEAEQELTRALEIVRLQQKDEHADMRQVYGRLARVCEALGRGQDAEKYKSACRAETILCAARLPARASGPQLFGGGGRVV